MNERIKELAEQANCSIDGMGYGEGNVEKFAELMVEEFQTILRDNSGADTGTLSYRVEEHFRS